MKQIRQQDNYEYIFTLLLIRTFVIVAANLFCRDYFKSKTWTSIKVKKKWTAVSEQIDEGEPLEL